MLWIKAQRIDHIERKHGPDLPIVTNYGRCVVRISSGAVHRQTLRFEM